MTEAYGQYGREVAVPPATNPAPGGYLPVQGHYGQPPAPYGGQVPTGAVAVLPRKQGAWGLWWLCFLTCSIYYVVWYDRINGELAAVLGQPRAANGRWFNCVIPFWALVGLVATAERLNAAHAAVGSPTRVSGLVTAFLAPIWFASQSRYLQRRMNTLHDALASRAGY